MNKKYRCSDLKISWHCTLKCNMEYWIPFRVTWDVSWTRNYFPIGTMLFHSILKNPGTNQYFENSGTNQYFEEPRYKPVFWRTQVHTSILRNPGTNQYFEEPRNIPVFWGTQVQTSILKNPGTYQYFEEPRYKPVFLQYILLWTLLRSPPQVVWVQQVAVKNFIF